MMHLAPRLLLVTTVASTLRAFLLPLADRFRELGWQVDAMAQGIERVLECRERFDRCHCIRWSRRPWELQNLVTAPRQIRQVVVENQYDIVHVHTPVAAFITRLALRRQRGRLSLIYTAHGFHFHPGGSPVLNHLFAGLERLAAAWTDHLVVINQTDYAAARRLRLAPDSRLHLMPGIGVDLAQYAPDPAGRRSAVRLREEIGLPADAPLLLMVAAFQGSKRHGDLLRALSRLNRPDVHLALAGDGPLLPQCISLAHQLGLANRVHFLGYRRDIPALMRAADGLVLPSEREGLPRSVLEAMAIGLPVVGTAIRGVEELLGDGCGLMVPVGDVNRLALSLERLLAQPGEAAEMAAAARRRVEGYVLERVLHLHEELYSRALQRKGGAAGWTDERPGDQGERSAWR